MLEKEEQTVALVLDDKSAVTGLLTRDRILEVLQGDPVSRSAGLTVGAATGKD